MGDRRLKRIEKATKSTILIIANAMHSGMNYRKKEKREREE